MGQELKVKIWKNGKNGKELFFSDFNLPKSPYSLAIKSLGITLDYYCFSLYIAYFLKETYHM